MEKSSLEASLTKLNKLKLRIGQLTYGDARRSKYAVNNLFRGIEEATSYLEHMDLPADLSDARSKAVAQVKSAFSAIKQEYSSLKPNPHKPDEISPETSRQSEIIRNALSEFDAAAV